MRSASRVTSAYLCGLGLLAAISALCYGRVLRFGFAYDDQWTIVDNRSLSRPLAPLLRAVLSGSEQTRAIPDSTRPTMIVSEWIDRQVFGLEPAGAHLQSLALYALVSALAGLALLRLSRSVRIAVVGGAFFALAPVHAEVVSAINYREDLLAAIGVLIPLVWLFGPRWQKPLPHSIPLVAFAFAVGLFGKENAVALAPLVVGLYAVRRPDGSWVRARASTFIALGCVLLVWSAWRVGLRLSGVDDVPLAQRTGVAATLLATVRYEVRAVAGALLPFGWSPEYAPERPAELWWVAPFLALLLATFALARRKVTRVPAMGLVILLLAPLATSPLIGPANERADRFLFLGVLGAALVWGWLADILVETIHLPKPWRAALLGAALAPCVLVSQQASAAWVDDLSLWTVATARAPESYRAWTGLSRALRLEGRLPEADAAVARALALFPRSLSAHVTRAYNRLARGDVVGARLDIARVRELGGPRQKGLRRAERCAALTPAEAQNCIRERPTGAARP